MGSTARKSPVACPSAITAADFAEQREEVLLRNALQMRRFATGRAHHFALHDPGIQGMTGDVVEVRAHVGQQFLPRRQVARERLVNAFCQTAKDVIEDGAVKSFLVLEVVVQQCLVDSGSARDGIGARPGHAFTGEFSDRSLQDGGAAFFGLSPGAQARFGDSGFHGGTPH